MSLLSLSKKILGGQEAEKKAAKKGAAKTATKPKKEKKAEAKKSVVYSATAGEMGLSLIVSEKSMAAQAQQTLVARVNPKTSKGQIASAIEEMFGVKVLSVRTSLSHPKIRRRGMSEGKTRAWKKAYITVDDISKINVAP